MYLPYFLMVIRTSPFFQHFQGLSVYCVYLSLNWQKVLIKLCVFDVGHHPIIKRELQSFGHVVKYPSALSCNLYGFINLIL